MSKKNFGLDGIAGSVELSKGGARIKNNSGAVEAKNNADNAYAVMRAAPPVAANDVVTKQYLETYGTTKVAGNIYNGGAGVPASSQFTGAGQEGMLAVCNEAGVTTPAFTRYKLYRLDTWSTDVAGSTWTEITPAEGFTFACTADSVSGTDTFLDGHSYMLQAGVWIDLGPASAVSRVGKYFAIPLVYSDSSPLAVGTLPAGAIVTRVQVAVTEVFNGTTPLLDVGVAGTVAKFADNTLIDLKHVGVYDIEIQETSAGEDAILTYAAGGGTPSTGAAQALLEYYIA